VSLDFARPLPAAPLTLISGQGHHDVVVQAILAAELSVWIATANLKELMIEDGRARPGQRRGGKRRTFRSILASLEELSARGVELRVLHAELPSRPFRAEFDRHPRLIQGGLELRTCPRVHLKTVIIDGRIAYLGSANWTGAGLGAKGTGRRNFELGVVSEDPVLLDEVQAIYERLWRGVECKGCKLRDLCPGPLDGGAATAPRRARAASPRRSRR
jgi:phosphatidylserine/phosphatidylglycerophosphate/cardiolipin synthase-like enzyme